MNLNIHAKNCDVSESMREYARSNFSFVSNYNDSSTQITIEVINKNSVQVKSVVKVKSESVVVSVTAPDYYQAITSASKKMKSNLLKATKIKKRHECDSIAESFIKSQEEVVEDVIIEKHQTPLYQMGLAEAISQLQIISSDILFFTEDGINIKVLTKGKDDSIKLFSVN